MTASGWTLSLTKYCFGVTTHWPTSPHYGMSEAYEKKRLEILDWLKYPRERVRALAARYIAEVEAMRDNERRRADESIALRKFEYGEE